MKYLLATLTLLSAASITHAQQVGQFPVTTLSAGIHAIKAEVATTEEEREQGLMFRKTMGRNEGMLFVFPGASKVCMWMKNTLLPLSVAFIDQAGIITNIEDMEPQTLDSHCGSKPVNYALEMNLGWFKQHSIQPGMTIDGLQKGKASARK